MKAYTNLFINLISPYSCEYNYLQHQITKTHEHIGI